MKNNPFKYKTNSQSGVTLIEVLITLVIVSVGILGLASLQLRAMQFVHSAYIHTQVQILAYDIMDRMRSNRVQAMSTNNYLLDLSATAPDASTNCAVAECSSSQMTAFDLFEWRSILADHLPQGTGQIAFTDLGGGGRVYTIDIQWLDDRSVEVTDQASFNERFQTFTFKADL